jgi:hypothetical protein
MECPLNLPTESTREKKRTSWNVSGEGKVWIWRDNMRGRRSTFYKGVVWCGVWCGVVILRKEVIEYVLERLRG